MKIPEVAERLRVTERTVRARIARGDLIAVKLGPEMQAPVRVDEAELDAFIYSPRRES